MKNKEPLKPLFPRTRKEVERAVKLIVTKARLQVIPGREFVDQEGKLVRQLPRRQILIKYRTLDFDIAGDAETWGEAFAGFLQYMEA